MFKVGSGRTANSTKQTVLTQSLAVFALQAVYRKQSCWFQTIEQQKYEQVKSNNNAESYKNINKHLITIFAIKQLVKYIYLCNFI